MRNPLYLDPNAEDLLRFSLRPPCSRGCCPFPHPPQTALLPLPSSGIAQMPSRGRKPYSLTAELIHPKLLSTLGVRCNATAMGHGTWFPEWLLRDQMTPGRPGCCPPGSEPGLGSLEMESLFCLYPGVGLLLANLQRLLGQSSPCPRPPTKQQCLGRAPPHLIAMARPPCPSAVFFSFSPLWGFTSQIQ